MKSSCYLVWLHEDHIHLFDDDRIEGKQQLAMELQIARNNKESQLNPWNNLR